MKIQVELDKRKTIRIKEKKMTKTLLKAQGIAERELEVFGVDKATDATFEKYSQNEKNFLKAYIYMIESNLTNGAKKALEYNMTLNYFTKLSTNGVSLSPSFMKDYGDSEVGAYLSKLDAKVKEYSTEALTI